MLLIFLAGFVVSVFASWLWRPMFYDDFGPRLRSHWLIANPFSLDVRNRFFSWAPDLAIRDRHGNVAWFERRLNIIVVLISGDPKFSCHPAPVASTPIYATLAGGTPHEFVCPRTKNLLVVKYFDTAKSIPLTPGVAERWKRELEIVEQEPATNLLDEVIELYARDSIRNQKELSEFVMRVREASRSAETLGSDDAGRRD